ncbi:FecR family protein [Congregicoccus parvus]|uniref:FecR family protein n=1 Tax=Congregicoccus parvus TaxID=3081749 RepID=UPI003FA549DD
MRRTHEDARIDAAAARWIALRDGNWSSNERARCDEWRAEDVRHERAFRRLDAATRLLGSLAEADGAGVLLDEVDALEADRARRRRSSLRWWSGATGLAAAAAVVLALLFVGRPSTRVDGMRYDNTTTTERSVDLEDGSTVVLAAASTVEVLFDAGTRRLDLARGEAHFAVAHEAARPFRVVVGPLQVQAVGTAFTVRRSETIVDVVVTEGRVAVARAGVPLEEAVGGHALSLVAGERVVVDTASLEASGTSAEHVALPVIDRGRWETPRLVFSETTLAEAVAHFNRHSRLQVEIGHPSLRGKRLGGNFRADNAEAFIDLLVASGEARVERRSETHVILHVP